MDAVKSWAFPVGWTLLAAVGLCFAGVVYWFDPAAHGFYPQCLFHRLTGLLCPGCGALRAGHQLLHGHLGAAFHLNPLLVLAVPLAGVFAISRKGQAGDGSEKLAPARRLVLWLLLAAMAVLAIWRNVPGTRFALSS